jgi:putative DNA-invertase from lambdoid prophage Rac
MSRIAYYRVSTKDQSLDAQRTAMGGGFAEEFSDEGVSGATMAEQRPGFSKCLAYLRKGDMLCVYAVDRLGRDSIDVQSTVRDLMDKGVTVDVHGLGPLVGDTGKLILAVMAQLAEMERRRIAERTEAGREAARLALATTGRTHRGKASLGRPVKVEPADIREWRKANTASIKETAEHFGVHAATVSRACAEVAA